MLQVIQAERKPFDVEAVQVTLENMKEVSVWCDGFINNSVGYSTKDVVHTYIQVKVNKPQTPRQTQAYEGDWILKTKTGFRVYTKKAFEEAFQEKRSVCGSTEFTMDSQPCVFERSHRFGTNPTGCRSATDYKVIGKIPANFQKHLEKNPGRG